ncbi:WhiB family transcriptional regulator [Streptomyces sp. NPDC004232]|uniref:WhiB family transcriptional regulator n=1 Tax=unclassified Streptomyces TaxID=2593676 RepID=UPI001DE56B41|nr:WhiB family transcriptional regulator [Streptomyces sp. tea 10]
MTAERGDQAAYWRDQAACLRADPELFFPVGSSGLLYEQIAEAKAVCGQCRVSRQCLDWAVRAGQVHGVWGGTTEGERREMRRREIFQVLNAVIAA